MCRSCTNRSDAARGMAAKKLHGHLQMNASKEHEAIAESRRAFARQVVERLRQAGFEALWAGGCVRDLLLESPPIDYDVATSARPEQVRELFGHRRTLAVGAAFGVIIVLGPHSRAGQVEVATYRNDASYSDGRRPDAVVYSTAIEDARRRDFTINGMFYDPLTEEVIDYVGGREDLQRGLIRAIGDANARIAEDKLRLLRAVRFAARFGFAIEASTQAALARHAADLRIVSGERMTGEMHKTLITSGRETAVRQWAETGMLAVLLPPLAEQWAAVGEHASALVRAVRPDHWIAPLAAALFPLVGTQPDVEKISGLLADLKTRLKFSNEDLAQLKFALESQSCLESAQRLPWSQVQPRVASSLAPVALDLLEARVACGESNSETLAWLRAQRAQAPEVLDPPPLITGHDLHQLGLAAGPTFKELLDRVRALQLDGQLHSRESALQWLREKMNDETV